MTNENISSDDEVIRVYNSKIKYGLLALLSFGAAGTAAYTALLNKSLSNSDMLLQFGAGGVAVIVGMVLFSMGFSKNPTLIIDHNGVTCSRPNTGLIPWQAISGLGMSQASIVRGVLLVSIEPANASEEQQDRWNRHISSGFMNPAVSRFQRQLQAKLIISIPISFLAISGKKLKAEIAKKVHRYDDNEVLS